MTTPTLLPSTRTAAIWSLRILLHQDRFMRALTTNGPSRRHILTTIGASEEIAAKPPPELRPFLCQELRRLQARPYRPAPPLEQNVATLARSLGLSGLDRKLVLVAALLELEQGLRECVDLDRAIPTYQEALIAVALRTQPAALHDALRSNAPLRDSGLLAAESSQGPLCLARGLAGDLHARRMRSVELVGRFVRRARRTALPLGAFDYMRDAASLVAGIVRGALERHAQGVHVLIHGATGTGKTALAHAVAKEVGGTLHDVSDEDAKGEVLSGKQRLRSCAVAHRILARVPRAVLLFDEAEDAFPLEVRGTLGATQNSTPEKAWTHRMLERAPVPTVWTANAIHHIDPATLRRFTLVVEMLPPPAAVRERMLRARLRGTSVSSEWTARVAKDERMTPGEVERLRTVALLLGPRSTVRMERALCTALDSSLARIAAPAELVPYDLDHVNANVDLRAVLDGLRPETRASICLYGPPGTGKSALARHMGERLGRPVLSARASDVLGAHVGQTERNLARLFRRAAAERSLLFLDEADSFLQDRSRAQRSWEFTQVNELLVQMDAFPGVFVCATNLVDTLDVASLRRFALKIRLDPLRPEQSVGLLASLAEGEVDAWSHERLVRMTGVTTGDFASVAQQLRLLGTVATSRALVDALTQELALRRPSNRVVLGFGRPDLSLAPSMRSDSSLASDTVEP